MLGRFPDNPLFSIDAQLRGFCRQVAELVMTSHSPQPPHLGTSVN